jgi:hypothetical protein
MPALTLCIRHRPLLEHRSRTAYSRFARKISEATKPRKIEIGAGAATRKTEKPKMVEARVTIENTAPGQVTERRAADA